jgi:hypothetical protein
MRPDDCGEDCNGKLSQLAVILAVHLLAARLHLVTCYAHIKLALTCLLSPSSPSLPVTVHETDSTTTNTPVSFKFDSPSLSPQLLNDTFKMRLLKRLFANDDNGFSLVEHFGDNIPSYAILSHTWGDDGDEVTFKDLTEDVGKSKPGYGKLTFCCKQAAQDGLDHFWVDTCCIDKSSSAELAEALNSMYRWYQNSAKCYVYLSDVSISSPIQDVSLQTCTQHFEKSRWFKRGWTLQELLAPSSIHFYSKEEHLLGDKISLLQALHSTTSIPMTALQGRPMSQFSVDERMHWTKERQTKRGEDMAYSLLGIFDICMPLIYGEGQEKALARLRRKIDRAREGRPPLAALPIPSLPWMVPFRRDNDFIERDSLDKVCRICAEPAARAALVGLGGVGWVLQPMYRRTHN